MKVTDWNWLDDILIRIANRSSLRLTITPNPNSQAEAPAPVKGYGWSLVGQS